MARYNNRNRRRFQNGGNTNDPGMSQTATVGAGSPAESAGSLTLFPVDPTEGVDKITDTIKVTAGYFPGGGGTLTNTYMYTGSLADSNEEYYFNVTDEHPESSSAQTVFSVTYGHAGGSGSKVESNTISETEAIYKQWATTLLPENEITGGFFIKNNKSQGTTGISTGSDQDIYVLVGKRSLFKDRINKKNWTLTLSGSTSFGKTGTKKLSLTDDSNTTTAVASPAGPRYNIVSGALGTVVATAATKTYGFLYPNFGVMIFSAQELSGAIPGYSQSVVAAAAGAANKGFQTKFAQKPDNYGLFHTTASLGISQSRGFATALGTDEDKKNALRFVNCLRNIGSSLTFRSEEDQVSVSYFCRSKAAHANYSNNPTFTSGSQNIIRHDEMHDSPETFINGIALMNSSYQIVATGKISSPVKKNFGSESTIKVKLTY